jgi:hypothetical protein
MVQLYGVTTAIIAKALEGVKLTGVGCIGMILHRIGPYFRPRLPPSRAEAPGEGAKSARQEPIGPLSLRERVGVMGQGQGDRGGG